MNLKRHIPHLVLGAFVTLLALSACQNPIALLQRSGSNGVISVAIQRVSPLATTLLQTSNGGATASIAAAADRVVSTLSGAQTQSSPLVKSIASRTFLAADNVQFTLYDSSSNVVSTWSYQTSTDTFTNSTIGISNQSVPSGSNYTLQADIYNTANATGYQLTASGTSAPFSVAAGGSASVSVICLPDSPPALAVGGTSMTVTLTPWVADPSSSGSPYTVTTTGSEQWYQVNLTAGNTYVVSAGGTTVNYAVVGVFDSSGTTGPLAYGESDLGGETSSVTVTPTTTGTYYVAVIERVDSSSSTANPESVTVGVVQLSASSAPLPVFESAYPSDSSTEGVLLYWTASSAQTNFEVLRDTGPSSLQTDVTLQGGSTGYYQDTTSGRWYFIDTTAAYGTNYRYQVVALDSSGTPIAGASSAFVAAPLSAPASVSATNSSTGSGIDVSFGTVTNATIYYVEVIDASGNSIDYATPFSSPVTIPNSGAFIYGTTYYVVVAGFSTTFGYFNISGAVNYTGS